jgi:hypothetical protein
MAGVANVPQRDVAALGHRDECLVVLAERRGVDESRVWVEGGQCRGTRHVPQAYGAVVAAAGEQVTSVAEADELDQRGVPGEADRVLPGVVRFRGVPEQDGVVGARGGCEGGAARVQRQCAGHPVGGGQWRPELNGTVSVRQVPQPHVRPAVDEQRLVGAESQAGDLPAVRGEDGTRHQPPAGDGVGAVRVEHTVVVAERYRGRGFGMG